MVDHELLRWNTLLHLRPAHDTCQKWASFARVDLDLLCTNCPSSSINFSSNVNGFLKGTAHFMPATEFAAVLRAGGWTIPRELD